VRNEPYDPDDARRGRRRCGGHPAPGPHDTPDTVVDGNVDTDSREISAGDIFVAKPGEVTDGHNFVAGAVASGAVLAIVERRVEAPVSQIVVADAVAALSDLARTVVAACARPWTAPDRRHHGVQRQDDHEEHARPHPGGGGRDRRPARLVQQRGRRAADDAAGPGGHALPGQRVRRIRPR
jgi:hypothetical protein